MTYFCQDNCQNATQSKVTLHICNLSVVQKQKNNHVQDFSLF